MPSADSGTTKIGYGLDQPVFKANSNGIATLNDPVAYISGSTPTITTTLQVNGTLPKGTEVTLTGNANLGGGVPTTSATATATGNQNEILTFTVNLPRLTQGLVQWERHFTITWSASIGGGQATAVGTSDDPLMVTFGMPVVDDPNFNDLRSVPAQRLYLLTGVLQSRDQLCKNR